MGVTDRRVLPPLQILADAFGFLFGHFSIFYGLAALPILMLCLPFLTLWILAPSGWLGYAGSAAISAFWAIFFIAYVLSLLSVTTAWHRTVLGGQGEPRLRLGKPEWRYLGYSLLLLIGWLVTQVAGASLAGVVPVTAGKIVATLVPLLILFVVAARVVLVLPAAAAGEALSLIDAWDLARGNGLRLIGLFAVILVSWWLFSLAGQMLVTDPAISPSWGLAVRCAAIVVGFFYWGLIVAAMSLCYRRLAGDPA